MTGLTVTLTLPDGTTSALSPSQIQNVTSTLFQMSVVLAAEGTYSLRVTTPSGGTSAPWTFTVAKAGSM